MKRPKELALLLREAIWPERMICLCCQEPSGGGELCAACEKKLEALRITGPICECCGHPLEAGQCDFCDQTGVAKLRAVWIYEDQSRALVHALKYHGIAAAGRMMAAAMASVAQTLALPPDTVVTWPTMPARRKLERGIDHSKLLAETVGERLGLPVRRLLTRSDRLAKGTQEGKNRTERLQRLRGAFSCEEIVSGTVLLIDDVVTTSATAMACVQCLLDAGAREVIVLTAGQTQQAAKKKGRNDGRDENHEGHGAAAGGGVHDGARLW